MSDSTVTRPPFRIPTSGRRRPLLKEVFPGSKLIPLTSRPLVVGRTEGNVNFPADPLLSRKQLELSVDSIPRARDLDSHNGSWLNGARFSESELADGDAIRIGGTLLVFRW